MDGPARGYRETGAPVFPDSLCHLCGAPPRFIRTDRSTFIHCPILKRYPPQPVRVCAEFVPKAGAEENP